MAVSCYVFYPISPGVLLWSLFLLVVISADFVLTIIAFCFRNEASSNLLYLYLDYILPPLLLMDILVSCNTCLIKKGVVVSFRPTIIRQYALSVYFWIDLSSLIVSVLQTVYSNGATYNPAFNFLVFVKMIKLVHFDRLLSRYGSFRALLVYQFLKNVFLLALLCHVMGSFFFYLDLQLLQTNSYQPSQLWLFGSSAYPNIYIESFFTQYTYSFYFAIELLSGVAYGDLTPINPVETLYVCFMLLLPITIYSYIFSSIYSVLNKRRSRNRLIEKNIVSAKQLLEDSLVEDTLKAQCLSQFAYQLKRDRGHWMQLLKPTARREYRLIQIAQKFDMQYLSARLSISPPATLEILLDTLAEKTYSAKTVLPGKCLYYLNKGVAAEVLGVAEKKYHKFHYAGQLLNWEDFLTGLAPTQFVTSSLLICQTVPRGPFLTALRRASLHEGFHEKIMSMLQFGTGRDCFFCDCLGHNIHDCPHLRPQVTTTSAQNTNAQQRSAYRRTQITSGKLVGTGRTGRTGRKEVDVDFVHTYQAYYPLGNITQQHH